MAGSEYGLERSTGWTHIRTVSWCNCTNIRMGIQDITEFLICHAKNDNSVQIIVIFEEIEE